MKTKGGNISIKKINNDNGRNMNRIIAKIYYDKAKELYPNEKDKTRLMDIAVQLKITMNSFYGNYTGKTA